MFQNAAAPSPLGQMPPQDGMPGGPMPGGPAGFFPVSVTATVNKQKCLPLPTYQLSHLLFLQFAMTRSNESMAFVELSHEYESQIG